MSKEPIDSEFDNEMTGVKPLKQDTIAPRFSSKKQPLATNNRQKAAVQSTEKYLNFLTDGEVDAVSPEEIISFKMSGIQPNLFKNLKNAKYAFDDHLDLHGQTVSQAREAVFRLISQAETEDLRCFLITHGKGNRSNPPAKLKSYVSHWLKQIDQVVAFHSALAKHGGSGSVYVLLKKAKHIKAIHQKRNL